MLQPPGQVYPFKVSSEQYKQVWIDTQVKMLSKQKKRAYSKKKDTYKYKIGRNLEQLIKKSTWRACYNA